MGRYLGQFRPEFSRVHRDPDLNWFAPFTLPYVVGVIGDRFSGKSTVMTLLAENHGFRLFTLGAQLRDMAFRSGVSVRERQALGEFAAEVRADAGDGGVLARRALRRMRALQQSEEGLTPLVDRIAISGIKHSEELQVLQRIASFRLFEVVATVETRLVRATLVGQLEAEYEAQAAADAPSFGELRGPWLEAATGASEGTTPIPAELVAFFADCVDQPENEGRGGERFGPQYAGGMRDVRAAIDQSRRVPVPNDHHSLPDLEDTIDKLLHREMPGTVQIGL